MSNITNLYQCCRWCKWFEMGCCINPDIFSEVAEMKLFPFWEDGHLSEAIREGFKEFKFPKLEFALVEAKLSNKRIKEIMDTFRCELELDAQPIWTEEIDETISMALNNFSFDSDIDGMEIKNPEGFYCKHFW